jgi:hypothetical protein
MKAVDYDIYMRYEQFRYIYKILDSDIIAVNNLYKKLTPNKNTEVIAKEWAISVDMALRMQSWMKICKITDDEAFVLVQHNVISMKDLALLVADVRDFVYDNDINEVLSLC